jgi:N-carbamoyl-L-amino-acid hydrolase
MTDHSIDAPRLTGRLRELGTVGRNADGKLVRLAASQADRLGRDWLRSWLADAGLDVVVDRIGNVFGVWTPPGTLGEKPILLGSHIDTVIDAGIYDGCYGVLAGLEVIQSLKEGGFAPSRPLAVAAFTNEEGVRYAPDMLGSLAFVGGLDLDAALATVGTDGSVLGEELDRIGYAGYAEPGFIAPHAYLELHIEQGPVLDRESVPIGAVQGVQGISWQKVMIEGDANHAGTTPMSMRRDAGHAAARVITFVRGRAVASNTPTVATVGCMSFEPNAINVIPSRATFTVDLRDPDEDRLREEEAALSAFLDRLAGEEDVKVTVERLARFMPVPFDQRIVAMVEEAARDRGLASRRITSGAGHDAQMIARIAPAAMIFVPCTGGISHSPKEFTADADLIAGANVLLDVVRRLAKDDR